MNFISQLPSLTHISIKGLAVMVVVVGGERCHFTGLKRTFGGSQKSGTLGQSLAPPTKEGFLSNKQTNKQANKQMNEPLWPP